MVPQTVSVTTNAPEMVLIFTNFFLIHQDLVTFVLFYSCWVKNGKKGYFHASHLTPNPVFPKREVLESHSLLAH